MLRRDGEAAGAHLFDVESHRPFCGGARIPEISNRTVPHGVRAPGAWIHVEQGEGAVVLGRAGVAVCAATVRVEIDRQRANSDDFAVELVAVSGDVPAIVRDLEPVGAGYAVAGGEGGAEGDVGVGRRSGAADAGHLEDGVVGHGGAGETRGEEDGHDR